jgi:hypothetical protein
MNDAALRRRVVALVIAALFAMSAAAGTSAMFANNAQADDSAGNTGNVQYVLEVQQSAAASSTD